MARPILELGGGSPLGREVRGVRAWKKWSQARLARACGISRGTISHIEDGSTHYPSDEVLICIAEKGEKDPKILFELRKPPFQNVETTLFSIDERLGRIEDQLTLISSQLDTLAHSNPNITLFIANENHTASASNG